MKVCSPSFIIVNAASQRNVDKCVKKMYIVYTEMYIHHFNVRQKKFHNLFACMFCEHIVD